MENWSHESHQNNRELSTIYVIDVEKIGTELHRCLGIGERHRDPFHKIFFKFREDHSNLNNYLLLAIDVKEIYDTLGPEGIVQYVH